ncbi:hypothetical protein HWV62_30230 [Athelia sp. TMB]|nr:hypothetical protein HWV62_30230 [Athelia sp. TMB]
MFIFSNVNPSCPAADGEALVPPPSIEERIASINTQIIKVATPLAGPQQNPEAKMNDGSEDDMDTGRWYIPPYFTGGRTRTRQNISEPLDFKHLLYEPLSGLLRMRKEMMWKMNYHRTLQINIRHERERAERRAKKLDLESEGKLASDEGKVEKEKAEDLDLKSDKGVSESVEREEVTATSQGPSREEIRRFRMTTGKVDPSRLRKRRKEASAVVPEQAVQEDGGSRRSGRQRRAPKRMNL